MIGRTICFTAVLMLLTLSAGTVVAKAQRTFASPEEALSALMEAARASDTQLLAVIFGPEGKDILSSGDSVRDARGRETFVHLFDEKHSIERQQDGRRATIVLGDKEWPFPVPLVESGGAWSFDTAQGRDEILNRRIGRNELDAISVCHAYVEAQKEYASADRDGDGLKEYAQVFISAHNKKNGLFWPKKAGERQSPLGPLVAQALQEGYSTKQATSPRPFHGYYFRILMEQGQAAPGGRMSYITQGGRMTRGFGLIAWPVKWNVSGVMTFMIGEDGKVYQQNLGPDTGSEASAVKAYNPSAGWKPV